MYTTHAHYLYTCKSEVLKLNFSFWVAKTITFVEVQINTLIKKSWNTMKFKWLRNEGLLSDFWMLPLLDPWPRKCPLLPLLCSSKSKQGLYRKTGLITHLNPKSERLYVGLLRSQDMALQSWQLFILGGDVITSLFFFNPYNSFLPHNFLPTNDYLLCAISIPHPFSFRFQNPSFFQNNTHTTTQVTERKNTRNLSQQERDNGKLREHKENMRE